MSLAVILGLGARQIGGDPLFTSASLWWEMDQLNTVLVRGPGDPFPVSRPLSSFWTFTRASAATRVNAAGLIESVANDVARIDHDPVTLQPRGLLIEGQRTNLLLNSLINGTSLATQSVAVTAAAHTLSFYGTGTITLSGAHSATLVGTGAYPARTTITFTPTAGTLTLTVTGTVQFAQLEAGAFASSYIPTGASQVTRAADNATVTGANFSDWYNQAEGTFAVEGRSPATVGNLFGVSDGTISNRINVNQAVSGVAAAVSTGGTNVAIFGSTGGTLGNVTKRATAYRVDDFAYCQDAGAVLTDPSGAVPVGINQIRIGGFLATTDLFGHIRRIRYWPTRLTNAQLQEITA